MRNYASQQSRALSVRWFVEITSRSAFPALALAVMTSGATEAGAQSWPGPSEVCSPETMLRDWDEARTRLADYGIGFGLQEQTELWGNLAGGIKQGAAYDGLTTADLCIDLDKAAHWKGAKIYSFWISDLGPWPDQQSSSAHCSLSAASRRSPAQNFTIYGLQQDLFDGKISFRFGQGGVDDEFMSAPYDASIPEFQFYPSAVNRD